MKILVTGSAGFIGFHLAEKLLSLGHTVIGIDNLNDYYDLNLKKARLKIAKHNFLKLDLNDSENLNTLFSKEKFDLVCNMAAQAGVRYSIENPGVYIKSNIDGFFNILEACRLYPVKHLVYASSSSVYGMNDKIPFSIEDKTDNPVSLYAATKKSNELMAYTYSHLYNIPVTGLRFFTVYGPWGRPDMAYYKFTDTIMNDKPIQVFNNGEMLRDFTYIDDVIEGIVASVNNIPQKKIPYSASHALYNLGNNSPVKLLDFIETLENCLGKTAKKEFLEMQAGDVTVTAADIELTKQYLAWEPKTDIKEGLIKFTEWYKEYNT